MNPFSHHALPPSPSDAESVRERTRDACAQVDRSTPSQHDPTSSSWTPALPWLTGRDTERRSA